MPVTRFGLAPMSTDIRVLTWVALALPLVLALGASQARGPARAVLLAVSAVILVLYASVWLLWRPTAFEVDARGLRILWPLRVRAVPAHEVAEVVVLSREAFRREFGWGMRIGPEVYGAGSAGSTPRRGCSGCTSPAPIASCWCVSGPVARSW